MNVTGIGSTYNFIYNTKTNKLSAKDGSNNEFADYFNGDVKGEDTETLNHFDAHTKYQFQRMLYIANYFDSIGQNSFDGSDEVEISAEIESAEKTQFYINGQKSFTAFTGMMYLPSEILQFSMTDKSGSTTEPKSLEFHIPTAIHQAAIKRYEERMSDFLKNDCDKWNSGKEHA